MVYMEKRGPTVSDEVQSWAADQTPGRRRGRLESVGADVAWLVDQGYSWRQVSDYLDQVKGLRMSYSGIHAWWQKNGARIRAELGGASEAGGSAQRIAPTPAAPAWTPKPSNAEDPLAEAMDMASKKGRSGLGLPPKKS